MCNMGKVNKGRLAAGWVAVAITVIFTNLWAYWGIIENFHEGWYSQSILENLAMLFLQYLLITIIFCVLAVVSIRWPKAGLVLHIAMGCFLAWFFNGAVFNVVGLLIVIPLLAMGGLYFFGRPEPRKWAISLIIIIPLLIIFTVTPFKVYQLSQRVNDNNFGPRLVEGDGVSLTWAPRGPGWPEEGVTWYEAAEICRHLSADGTAIMPEEQNIWRLPTVDEAVASMMLHNENAEGRWDSVRERAAYAMTPDKETPLWDPNSQVIYYWTGSEASAKEAYIIVYHGGVFTRHKDRNYGYLSFRAVKNTD